MQGPLRGQAELLEAVGDKYQLTVYDGEYHTPRWFGEGITYNIFPDRFCRDKAPERSPALSTA